MQLKPGETFVIVRQLDNPADNATYYVQALIRDSKTDTLLVTLNLDNKGNQRFTKQWQVIPDPSGEGRYIDIESRVFTDSGHTTYSDVYAIENSVHLVAERPDQFMGGPGGDEVDYKKIKTILKEEISNLPKVSKEKVNLKGITDAINEVKQAISGMEPDKVELDPLFEKIEALKGNLEASAQEIKDAIEAKEVTEKTDLTPVMEKIDSTNPHDAANHIGEMVDNMKSFYNEDIKNILDSINKVYNMLKNAPFIPLPSTPIEKAPTPEQTVQTKRVRKI